MDTRHGAAPAAESPHGAATATAAPRAAALGLEPPVNHYFGAADMPRDALPGLARYSALETGDAALLGQRAAEVFADFLPESLENLSLESIRAGAMGRMERYGLYKSRQQQRGRRE